METFSWSRYILIAISAIIIGLFVYYFSSIVAYVLSAWVLSLIGQPLMHLFRRIKIGKHRFGTSLCAALTLGSFFLITGLVFLIFVPTILTQANNLAHVDYRAIAKALEEPYSRFNHWLITYGVELPENSLEELVRKGLAGWFEPNKVGNIIASFIAAIGNVVVNIGATLFITFFFLQERRLLINFILDLAPKEYEEPTRATIRHVTALLTRYFGGMVVQMTVITLFMTIVLSILGIKSALLIGLFGALTNVIPYLGPILGAAFAIFITISSNLDLDFYTEMLPMLIKVLIAFGIMQQLDNFFLQPYIYSTSVLAHPLEIFLAILMGAQIGGVGGMILAIPGYTILRVIAKEYFQHFKIVKKMAGRLEEEGF
jgi:predicted PurR-regulated permease PerM